MMFELSPFGIVLPEWVITAATVVVWTALIGAVLRLVLRKGRDRLRCPG
jgi:hypothetical protein